MNTNEKNRYETVFPGIRKDSLTGAFLGTKSINGKRYYGTFYSIKEAKHWKNTFVPEREKEPEIPLTPQAKSQASLMTFRDVWEKYKTQVLSSYESSTQDRRLEQAKFYVGLWDFPMSEINPQLISQYLMKMKEDSIKNSDGRRFCFDYELKVLKALFNWYREEFDYTFANPILKRHKVLGRIKHKVHKEKKMQPHEVLQFFDAMKENPFWHDFCRVQFYFANRLQETAGIQKQSVDLENKKVLIKEVVVWDRSTKKFHHLKDLPKNGEMRECFLNETLYEIFERRLKLLPRGCNFVFNIDGAPITYRQAQHQYNQALKRCGLDHKYSSTHIMRHSMATITRMVTGSLDATQAVTGHKDQRMAQHYASLSPTIQRTAIEQVENFLKKPASCVQMRAKELEPENFGLNEVG